MKVVNRETGTIEYRLNILGIQVTKNFAQLLAKWHGDDWVTIGPLHELPVHIPMTQAELKASASDALRITAYQYQAEHPDADLQQVLALEKEFDAAATTAMTAGSVGW